MTEGQLKKTGRFLRFVDPTPSVSSRVRENLLWAGVTVTILCCYLIAFGDKPAALFLRKAVPRFFLLHQAAHMFAVLGNSALYLIPSLLVYLVLRRIRAKTGDPARREKIARLAGICLFLFCAVAASGLLTDLLKILLGRPRPRLFFHEGLYTFSFLQLSAKMWSFPSGHANTIFALATACFLVARRWGIVLFFVAIAVAASRVLTNDHFPSDVLMGAYLGILTTVFLKQLFLRRGINIFPTAPDHSPTHEPEVTSDRPV